MVISMGIFRTLSLWGALILALFAILGAAPPAGPKVDCEACKGQKAKFSLYKPMLEKIKQQLAANRKYKEGLKPGDTSKRIKVSSNIFLLTARLEQVENGSSVIQSDKHKQRCEQCSF